MYNWGARRGSDRDLERRTRQIKEIVRLGTALRAETGVGPILAQLVNSINATIGFNAAAFNLIRQQSPVVEIAATAGISEADCERLRHNPPPVERLRAAMREEFRISRSYFISHIHKYMLEGVESVTRFDPLLMSEQRPRDAWHNEDTLLVPLISPRNGYLLCILSLDQPEDDKIPTQETIEIIELYADQAALAIDTSLLFAEREAERCQLDAALTELAQALRQVRNGDLGVRVRLPGQSLAPVGETFNAVLGTVGDVLSEVREASDVVSSSATTVRALAAQLVAETHQRAARIREVSREVGVMAESVRTIAETASAASATAREAIEISNVGRQSAEHAAEGMTTVREIALQSAKKIKRLSESVQEISEINQLVSDFASQTNLLALNASIEAARAGEQGRGFAVVAHEIRTVATNSADAAKQIHARIQNIQGETARVMAIIDHGTEQVVLQSELAAQAGAALEEVDATTQRIASAITAITDTATYQSRAATGISQATAEIATITEQTRESVDRMRISMDQLVDLASTLLRKIGVFQVGSAPAMGDVPGWILPPLPADALEEATTPMPAAMRPSSPAWASLGATAPHSALPLTPARPSKPLAGAAPRLVPMTPSGPLAPAPSGPLAPAGRPFTRADDTSPRSSGGDAPTEDRDPAAGEVARQHPPADHP
ncbi:MAG: hypothetical protein IVW57_08160 [Ktedonobacterales bacterium]|nr:hypothetical protein [Ktedonobacterales bacterium]